MKLETLIGVLDTNTIVRIVGIHTIYYGSIADFKDIKLAKRYVRAIFHYPTELLITLKLEQKECE